jgi:hypothetical protein
MSKKGVRTLGAVFNMDKHDQAGSHWVAVFVSLDKTRKMYGAFYYDSIGRPPPEEIGTWMHSLKVLVDDTDFKLTFNQERRQYRNTECGMFAMHFLDKALTSTMTFRDVCESMGNDDDMLRLRGVMYS